ncbi:MAG: hypothetical protein LH609_02435 [Rudanella sp.]|nr:hypothetical protein [Rudanella sp.]
MEDFDRLEIRLVTTARKIKVFNEAMAKQLALGVSKESLRESIKQRDEMEREFQWLSAQVRAAETVSV